jgi:hypothetical protein
MSITLRPANDEDDRALRSLAERDSATLPPGPHLLAIRDGELQAAISLSTRAVVADPFRHTAALCVLLRCAARQRTAPALPTAERRSSRPALFRERLA